MQQLNEAKISSSVAVAFAVLIVLVVVFGSGATKVASCLINAIRRDDNSC